MSAILKINSNYVGAVVAQRKVEVSFRSSATYAAAIGSNRDVYLDDRIPEGAIAPPSYITSLEWPLVSGAEYLEAIGVAPNHLFEHLLHAFQDSRFDSVIRVGDRLRLEAVLASVRQTASGVLVVTRLTTVRELSHEPVAESWFGSYFRNAKASDTCAALNPPTLGDPYRPLPGGQVFTISRARSHIYSECAGLWNPIHTELSFANSCGFADLALHGTLIWAMLGEQVIDRFLDGDPRRLRRLAARFRKPIFPDRPLIMDSAIAAATPDRACIEVSEQDGGEVIVDGTADFGRHPL